MIVILPAPRPYIVLHIVGQLDNVHTEFVKNADQLDIIFEQRRILTPKNHRRTPGGRNSLNVVRTFSLGNQIIVVSKNTIPLSNGANSFSGVPPNAQCHMNAIYATALPFFKSFSSWFADFQAINQKRLAGIGHAYSIMKILMI